MGCNKLLEQILYMFIVGQRPLDAIVIMTVAKEVVRGRSVRSDKVSVGRRLGGHVPCETKPYINYKRLLKICLKLANQQPGSFPQTNRVVLVPKLNQTKHLATKVQHKEGLVLILSSGLMEF